MNDNASFFSTVLPLSGGTMTGALNMGSQSITNSGNITIASGTMTAPTLIAGAYGAGGSAGDGFRINSTDLYGQTDASDKIHLSAVSGNATFAGTVFIPDGSNGSPALAFSADTDTGIIRVTTNALGVTAGGSRKFYVNATNAYYQNLDLVQIDAGNFLLNDSGATERSIRIQNSEATGFFGVEGSTANRFVGSAANNMFIGTTTADGIEFATDNTVRATIDSSGDAAFQGSVNILDGSTDFTISGDSNNNTYFISNGEFRIRPLGTTTNKLVIGSNGSITTDGAFTGTTASLETSSTTDHVLRLTDSGVINYDFKFPDSSTIQLECHATASRTLKIINTGGGLFNVDVEGHLDCDATTGRMSARIQDMFSIGSEPNGSMTTRYGNSSTRTYTDGGSSGYQGYVWANENWFPACYIPYSPNQVYRLSASIYQLTGSTVTSGATSRHYLGVAGYDENFNFLTVDGLGTYQYILGSNITVSTGDFLEVDVTLKGWQGSGGTNGNKMDQGTVYIRPLWLANYQSAGGTAVLTGFTIMPAGTVADNDSNAGTNY
jgi:hypothetical protein